MKAYETLAPYYDRFMSFLNYEEEAIPIGKYITATGAKRVLDLGAGSGGHLIPLLEQGFTIDALDISESMLQILQDKLKSRGLAATCICDDMCRYLSQAAYDFLYAFGDTVHHLANQDAFLAFLRCCHRNLSEGGSLAFTWRERDYFEDMAELGSFYEQHGTDYLLWTVDYESRNNKATIDYTAFICGGDRRFDKIEECHPLQVYTEDEIYLAAKQTGFAFCDDLAEDYFKTERDADEYRQIALLKKI